MRLLRKTSGEGVHCFCPVTATLTVVVWITLSVAYCCVFIRLKTLPKLGNSCWLRFYLRWCLRLLFICRLSRVLVHYDMLHLFWQTVVQQFVYSNFDSSIFFMFTIMNVKHVLTSECMCKNHEIMQMMHVFCTMCLIMNSSISIAAFPHPSHCRMTTRIRFHDFWCYINLYIGSCMSVCM